MQSIQNNHYYVAGSPLRAACKLLRRSLSMEMMRLCALRGMLEFGVPWKIKVLTQLQQIWMVDISSYHTEFHTWLVCSFPEINIVYTLATLNSLTSYLLDTYFGWQECWRKGWGIPMRTPTGWMLHSRRHYFGLCLPGLCSLHKP